MTSPAQSSDLPAAELAEIVAWLPTTLGPATRRIDTHGAHVFVGATETLKIKRPVAFAYMDFSTRAKRQAACLREVEINRPTAPDIYLGVDRITREPDGTLAINGRGQTLEFAVRMRSFPPGATFDCLAGAGAITPDLATELGDVIATFHLRLPPADPARGRPITDVAARLIASLSARSAILGTDAAAKFIERANIAVTHVTEILSQRRAGGATRRCHGDLHLANIVLWRGHPVPFDAIEFDEDLATIDPLYDLAFLLMDLHHRNLDAAATTVLNRYLWRAGNSDLADNSWAAMRALPLMIALRAIVRAVVGVDRAADLTGATRAAAIAEATAYLTGAIAALDPPAPRLIAVGGLSGTGKSTLASALAPGLGAVPGAIHLRSDLERKSILGIEPTARPGPTAYTADITARTYAQLHDKAARALASGYTVITDAVFAHSDERAALERIAADAGVTFFGFWLEAPSAALNTRIARRAAENRDASDATRSVLARQLTYDTGPISWHRVTAAGSPDATLAAVRAHLAGHA